MTSIDWFWTGRNNAVDRQPCGIHFDVGVVKVTAYWFGVTYGRCARMTGAPPRS
jgi:hypothetical protein